MDVIIHPYPYPNYAILLKAYEGNIVKNRLWSGMQKY